jgi:hypothetical protein
MIIETEALKLALEALEAAAYCVQKNYCPDKMGHDWDDTITAIKEVLAQPAQATSGWSLRYVYFDENGIPLMHREPDTVQVSPLEFVTRVTGKEEIIGEPAFWAQWPSKEKNT